MKGFLNLLFASIVSGVTTQAEINPRTAADGRHPSFITSFALPAEHPAWPEGTIMVAVMDNATPVPGQATALTSSATSNIIGVLQSRVAENETSGNVLIHGSVPAEMLKYIGIDGPVDATAGQIAVLRNPVGIYV
ncbi:MAG: hypothetical protein FWD36_03325 [Treponema sp.]|nr:hypothetical protein [Treponema sp.]